MNGAVGRRGFLLLLAGIPAAAQVSPRSRRSPKATGAQGNPGDTPLATFSGPVHEIDSKGLAIDQGEGDEANTLRFYFTHKTHFFDGDRKIKSSDIKVGDAVSVETKRALDGELEAINVRVEKPKPSQKTKTPSQ